VGEERANPDKEEHGGTGSGGGHFWKEDKHFKGGGKEGGVKNGGQ